MKKILISPDDVLIEIVLDDFVPGASFFVPCLNYTMAKDQITRRMRTLKMRVRVEPRIENETAGLRVWRRS